MPSCRSSTSSSARASPSWTRSRSSGTSDEVSDAMVVYLGVVLAGAVGAPLRYIVDGLVLDRSGGTFPLGTAVINITGSLLLGLLTGMALYHGFPATSKIVLGTGLCGSFTT